MTPPTDTDGLTASEKDLEAKAKAAIREKIVPPVREVIKDLLASLRAERLARVRAERALEEECELVHGLTPPAGWCPTCDARTDIAEILGEGKK
jgi:hypothetical protein